MVLDILSLLEGVKIIFNAWYAFGLVSVVDISLIDYARVWGLGEMCPPEIFLRDPCLREFRRKPRKASND